MKILLENGLLFINESFDTQQVSLFEMDMLLEEGWRNFGTYFFRHNLGVYHGEIRRVIPLRIRLSNFTLSKSQRRNLQRNQDLKIVIRPIVIDDEKEELFARHKQRFEEYPPDSIYTFISTEPDKVPSEAFELCVYEKEKLLAVSFFNEGHDSVSGIYAMFEPTETKRGLGILTMLLEIQYAIEKKKSFYYQGYAYEGNSFYDYKKRFRALEMYDWEGNWGEFKE